MKKTARRLRRRVLSVFTSVALVMTMMPAQVIMADTVYVCEVNGVQKTSFPTSMSGTIKLLQDVTITRATDALTSSVIIDLNGHNLTCTSTQNYPSVYIRYADTFSIIGDGTIYSSSPISVVGSKTANQVMTIGEGVTLDGDTGIFLESTAKNTKVDMNGTINADTFGITINGNLTDENAPAIMNIDGTINSDKYGIYAAGYGIWDITGSVTGGETGIEIRAGELYVRDGATVASTSSTFSASANNSGTTVVGAGIAVSQHTTLKPVYVSIEGGTVSGPVALYQANVQGNDSTATDKIDIEVSGGTFEGTVEDAGVYNAVDVENVDNFIRGGTYNEDIVSDYIAEGCATADQGSGTYGIAVETVCYIGETAYGTIQDAFAAVQSGQTIRLINDCTLTSTQNITGTITIDLNGKKITGTAAKVFNVESGATFNVTDSGKNGTIVGQVASGDSIVINNDGGTVNVTDATLIIAERALTGSQKTQVIRNLGTLTVTDAVIDNKSTGSDDYIYGIRCENKIGTAMTPGDIATITGTTIDCEYGYGIVIFQGDSLDVSDTTITAEFGISNNGNLGAATTMDVTDCNIKATETGIYHPGDGTLNISGGNIEGATGVEIRAGELNVTSGTIKGTSKAMESNANGNGTTTKGAGIAVVQHSTKLPIEVNISGGTISGYTALFEANTQNPNYTPNNIEMSVTGGTFKTINGGTDVVESEDVTGFISGGSFNKPLEQDECAAGLIPGNTGSSTYGVVADTYVAQIGANSYESIEAAYEAAASGATIKLIQDITIDEALVIAKKVTIDTQGKTLTGTASQTIKVTSAGELTIKDSIGGGAIVGKEAVIYNDGGKVTVSSGKLSIPAEGATTMTQVVRNLGTLTVSGGTIENKAPWKGGGAYAIRCENKIGDETTPGDAVTVSGNTTNILCTGGYGIAIFQGDSLTVKGGTIESAYGIANNGIVGEPTTMTITAGTITSTASDGIGIYHPGLGTLTIEGGTITGATGVEIRGGTLNLSGGTIVGTAEGLTSNPNGNGTTTTGAGIAIVQHNTKQPVIVNVTGGAVQAGVALYEANVQNNSADDIAKIDVDISGGTFTSTDTSVGAAVATEDLDNFIRGGEFNTEIDERDCASGYSPVTEPNSQGMYTVEVDPGLVEVASYKGDKEQEDWTYPEEDGKIFAGWYTDDTCSTPYTGSVGAAYPKFVDKNVLKARVQIKIEPGQKDSLRFITNIDKMDYLEVGFIFNNSGNLHKMPVSTVFRSLISGNATQLPTQYSQDASGFLVYNLRHIPATGVDLTATPYWVTADGTMVEGIASANITSEKINAFKGN